MSQIFSTRLYLSFNLLMLSFIVSVFLIFNIVCSLCLLDSVFFLSKFFLPQNFEKKFFPLFSCRTFIIVFFLIYVIHLQCFLHMISWDISQYCIDCIDEFGMKYLHFCVFLTRSLACVSIYSSFPLCPFIKFYNFLPVKFIFICFQVFVAFFLR